MNINTLKKDLESQGFSGNLKKDKDLEYFVFGISLKNGKHNVYIIAKIVNDVVYISSVGLIEGITIKELPGFMMLNDLLITGKLFLSTNINDEDGIKENTSLTLDYGFEIPEKYYSNDMLHDYIRYMFKNLEDLVFSD